jgi:DNA-directed RNA polymerase specialized sigma24 family protein
MQSGMSASDSDPPSSSRRPAVGVTHVPLDDAGGLLLAKGATLPANDPPARVERDPANDPHAPLANVVPLQTVSREAVRAFLARVDTMRDVRAIVAARVPATNVDDLVQDSLREALEAADRAPPHRADALGAWVAAIARRVVADFLEQRARRAKYQGPMPREEDDVERPEPSSDPRESDDDQEEVHTWLVRHWLEQQVADHPRDKETFEILLEHARDARTYQEIADARGLTLPALTSRIHEFKYKYVPRYKRWRNRAILLVLLGAAVIVAVIVMWLLRRPPEIGPDPSIAPPRMPAPSVTTSSPEPLPEPFTPALPRKNLPEK